MADEKKDGDYSKPDSRPFRAWFAQKQRKRRKEEQA